MRIKLDENLSRHLKAVLAALGHDAVTVGDEGLLGRSDIAVGHTAAAEGRMLFTLDAQFANLRAHPPGSHPGICLFRPRSHGPLAVNRFVEDFVRRADLEDLRGSVVVIEPSRLRVRRPETGR